MNSREMVLLLCTAVIVVFRAWFLARRLWNQPLDHGRGFFLNIEVPEGFYDGKGRQWLRRYRSVVAAEHLVEGLALIAFLVAGRIDMLPLWAGCSPLVFLPVMFRFTVYARRSLGELSPVRSAVAVSLDVRRLGEYLSWPAELGLIALLGGCWFLLVAYPLGPVEWRTPATLTWAVLWLLPAKVLAIRNNFPLPADRPMEHERWLDAWRRHSVRLVNALSWFFTAVLCAYALQHSVLSAPWLRWTFIGISLAAAAVMIVLLVAGQQRLAERGRDLRPAGSWTGPFQKPRLMGAGSGIAWGGAYVAGLIVLFAVFR